MARVDPLALDPQGVSLHQLATFVIGSDLLADAFVQSPLFTVQRHGDAVRAEWIANTPDEPLPYPLGRVTLHPRGILLEGFAETRLAAMRHHVDQLGALKISADETRTFRLEELLREPSRALDPLEESRSRGPTARDLARWYLRAGWTFQPRAELDGRPPYVAVQTGRGRKQLDALIEVLPAKLRERYPDFPQMAAVEIRRVLVPRPHPEPVPEAPPRTSRVPRRS